MRSSITYGICSFSISTNCLTLFFKLEEILFKFKRDTHSRQAVTSAATEQRADGEEGGRNSVVREVSKQRHGRKRELMSKKAQNVRENMPRPWPVAKTTRRKEKLSFPEQRHRGKPL